MIVWPSQRFHGKQALVGAFWFICLYIPSTLGMSGCAHEFRQRYDVWHPGVNPGLSLVRNKGSVEDPSAWTRLHRGLVIRVNRQTEPVMLVGANPSARVVMVLNEDEDLVSLPYERIDRLRSLSGTIKTTAAHRIQKKETIKTSIIAGALIGTIPAGMVFIKSAAEDDSFGMAFSVPVGGVTALLGALIGGLVGLVKADMSTPSQESRVYDKDYKIGPGDWRIVGGQTDTVTTTEGPPESSDP